MGLTGFFKRVETRMFQGVQARWFQRVGWGGVGWGTPSTFRWHFLHSIRWHFKYNSIRWHFYIIPLGGILNTIPLGGILGDFWKSTFA